MVKKIRKIQSCDKTGFFLNFLFALFLCLLVFRRSFLKFSRRAPTQTRWEVSNYSSQKAPICESVFWGNSLVCTLRKCLENPTWEEITNFIKIWEENSWQFLLQWFIEEFLELYLSNVILKNDFCTKIFRKKILRQICRLRKMCLKNIRAGIKARTCHLWSAYVPVHLFLFSHFFFKSRSKTKIFYENLCVQERKTTWDE